MNRNVNYSVFHIRDARSLRLKYLPEVVFFCGFNFFLFGSLLFSFFWFSLSCWYFSFSCVALSNADLTTLALSCSKSCTASRLKVVGIALLLLEMARIKSTGPRVLVPEKNYFWTLKRKKSRIIKTVIECGKRCSNIFYIR